MKESSAKKVHFPFDTHTHTHIHTCCDKMVGFSSSSSLPLINLRFVSFDGRIDARVIYVSLLSDRP